MELEISKTDATVQDLHIYYESDSESVSECEGDTHAIQLEQGNDIITMPRSGWQSRAYKQHHQ